MSTDARLPGTDRKSNTFWWLLGGAMLMFIAFLNALINLNSVPPLFAGGPGYLLVGLGALGFAVMAVGLRQYERTQDAKIK